jgi:hypothetical protein
MRAKIFGSGLVGRAAEERGSIRGRSRSSNTSKSRFARQAAILAGSVTDYDRGAAGKEEARAGSMRAAAVLPWAI